MKVISLRLHGFKSFADAIEVPVQPGITGIVGPNGCGKSNLVEALRFVMGESSYKAMRGGGMEDVIFSGSGNRPSRNMAEVTLGAERDEGTGNGPEQLEITRRIERDAGSSYTINGRDVRARDVQILFADAATGAHSSALVRQGQVAELIAAKPIARRGILEDAAGISGLHARRNEAEQKLRAAENNLSRLHDIMAEIESQLDGLKRQARQAVRYRKISEEIRRAEAILYVINWEGALARLAEAEAELQAAGVNFSEATAAEGDARKAETEAAGMLPLLRENAAAAAAKLERLKAAAAEIDREEAQLRARRNELIARRGQAEADLRHEGEIGGDANAAAERLDAEETKLKAESVAAETQIAAAAAAAETAASSVNAWESEFAAAAGALAAAEAERAARERAIREAQAKLRRLEEERVSANAQRAQIVLDEGADAEIAHASAALAEVEAAVAAREEEAKAAEAAYAMAREAERRARGPYDTAERAFGALDAEARMLAALLDGGGAGRFSPLIDSLEVAPGYEQALAAALGDDLDASLDAEAPVHWGAATTADADPALPDGVPPLVSFVRGPQNLMRRLRQIGVVATAEAASLQRQLAVGQRLVTRDGGFWRWDGLKAQAGSAAARALRLEQRTRQGVLRQQLADARRDVEKALDAFGAATQFRAEAEQIDAETRHALEAARQTLETRRKALIDAERRHARVVERVSAFAGALSRIESDTETCRAELRAAEDALAGLPLTADLEKKRDDVQAALSEERKRAAEARLDAERALHGETVRSRRLADIAAERERWSVRLHRAEERVAELNDRLAALDAEIDAVPDDPTVFEARRAALSGEIAMALAELGAANQELATAEAAHHARQEAARGAADALSEARERRGRDEERVIAAGQRKSELAQQIAEHFDRQLDDLRSLAGLAPDEATPEASAVETRLHKWKAERERLGGVNLRAEEESRELETRLGEMRVEKEDLEEAIKRLRLGIQNLNREGRQRLLAAFETVNSHFHSLFRHLFGGGTAELALVGSDDPLEAGLEIVARPPGKRPQSMTLLSGGEQALTALALIFAVFLTNPSPICVLDEVDAPLDDANVDRFCKLLDDMRRRTDTRFIVVTHNPITMAQMDRLLGVTMAERGVSQVVSVDLASAERFREAS